MDSCTENSASFAQMLEQINRHPTFSLLNGMRLTELETDRAVGVLDVKPSHFGLGETVHGGCLMTLADTVGGMAAMTRGGLCVTLDTSFHFLLPATAPTIRCEAKMHRNGRTVRVVDVSLTNAAGQEVAFGTFTFYAKDGSFLGLAKER